MATISKVNNVLCDRILKIDDVLKSNVRYFDDNVFCQQTTTTPTPTPTVTNTVTPSVTPTNTPTVTPTNTVTPTVTPTKTVTPTVTTTKTPTVTPTNTVTPTVTPTKTVTPTVTPTKTVTPSVTQTSTPPSVTPTPTPTQANVKCAEGHIPKDTVYSYASCCYPYGQITGNSGPATEGLTVCYFPYSASTGVTLSSPVVVCELSGLTSCCDIYLGYSELDPSNACAAEATLLYISVPCLESCAFELALNIYTDANCHTVAPDGYYSDGTNFYVMSGGVISGPFSC